jgi:tetratricopeptide (TPR) repeat protein
MICPMLSALKPVDESGRPVNRECIYEECRFFHREQRDCSLMMSSRAMLRMAEGPAGRPAPGGDGAGPAPPDVDRRITQVGKDLLQSSLEVQGVVREAEARMTASLQERLAAAERAIGDLSVQIGRSLQEGLLSVTARLDEQAGGFSGSSAVVAQLIAQMNALTEAHQKAAGRLREEMALAQAAGRRSEEAMAALEKKIDRSAEEGLQVSQLVTLIKGMTERTYAALRGINEGNRAVLQAIETQLQRDQADLARRRQDEALESNNRGVALYYRGALQAALEAFHRALELQPDYAEALNNMGLVFSRLGREKEAVEAFQAALKINPKMGEVFNNLGFLYHTSSQYQRAAEMFGKAIENAADSSIAYTNLGNSFYKMKQPERAVAAWRRALELDPMNEAARRGLRMFQQDAGSN